MFKFLRKLIPHRESKLKKFLLKKPIIIIITLLLIAGAAKAGFSIFSNTEVTPEEEIVAKQVKTVILDKEAENTDYIETSGVVKPASQVDIVAMANGTVRSIYFTVGDKVFTNKLLATLHDSAILTSLNNAQTNLSNAQNSYNTSLRLAEDTIHQAELGVETASKSIEAAEIGLATAENSLANATNLQNKSVIDTKNNALNSYNSYLNTVNSALNQINYILAVDGNSQLPGIAQTLGATNKQSVDNAEISYEDARNSYNEIKLKSFTPKTIEQGISEVITVLNSTKFAIDDLMVVLESTVPNPNFSESSLAVQRTAFINLRSQVVGAQTGANATLQGLQNIDLTNKQSLDQLTSAVRAAENQLLQARIGYDNAVIALNNAMQSKNQQIISAQTMLDNAQGQANLVGAQASDLSIKAPIEGQVIAKHVEIGAEVSPGQKIATISQAEMVKIEISLASEDIYKVSFGENVKINNELDGTITHIDPAADPITRKVKVEITFININNDLIPETFVDVSIPVTRIAQVKDGHFFVPLKAITITQNESYAILVKDGLAKKINIQIGKIEAERIEVVEGLNNGDELIIEGGKFLEDGDNIEVINQI